MLVSCETESSITKTSIPVPLEATKDIHTETVTEGSKTVLTNNTWKQELKGNIPPQEIPARKEEEMKKDEEKKLSPKPIKKARIWAYSLEIEQVSEELMDLTES